MSTILSSDIFLQGLNSYRLGAQPRGSFLIYSDPKSKILVIWRIFSGNLLWWFGETPMYIL